MIIYLNKQQWETLWPHHIYANCNRQKCFKKRFPSITLTYLESSKGKAQWGMITGPQKEINWILMHT